MSFGRNLFLGHFWLKWPKWQGVSLMVFLEQKIFSCQNSRNIPHLVHLDALITNPSINFGVRCCLVSWGGQHPWDGDRQKQTNYTSSGTPLDADYESETYFGIRWRLRGLGKFFTFMASHDERQRAIFSNRLGFLQNDPPVTPEEGHTYKFHTISERRHPSGGSQAKERCAGCEPPPSWAGCKKYVVFQTFHFKNTYFLKGGPFHPISPKRKHLRTREL